MGAANEVKQKESLLPTRWRPAVLRESFFSSLLKERLVWGLVVVMLGIATLHYQTKAETQLEKRLLELMQLVTAQQNIVVMQRELVTMAKQSVEISAQGRADCASSLEALTQHQKLIDIGLGLREVARRSTR